MEWKPRTHVRSGDAIRTTGIIELIGINETVSQDEYAGSETILFDDTFSGEILSFLFITEDGDVQEVEGRLLIFEDNPNISVGDTNLTTTQAESLIGVVNLASGDWFAEGGGSDTDAVAYITDTPVYFHETNNLYLVFYLTSVVDFNSDPADDERLVVNMWYRRDN